MTISYSGTPNTLAFGPGAGSPITGPSVSELLDAYNAMYKFASAPLYADYRDERLTGYPYGNAPWYTPAVSEDPNWIGGIVRMIYRRPPVCPNSNVTSVASTPAYNTPVSVGTPGLQVILRGLNLEYFVQIEAVRKATDYGIEYSGNRSRIAGTLAGT